MQAAATAFEHSNIVEDTSLPLYMRARSASEAELQGIPWLAKLEDTERRRAVVEERADRQAKAIAKYAEAPALTGRKKIGTGLE